MSVTPHGNGTYGESISRHNTTPSIGAPPAWVMAASVAVPILCELLLILHATQGHVLFTLDDPMIHLALAERLARDFHYGINPGAVASPSSSILYPFLLTPLIGLGQWGALLLSSGGAIAAVLLFGRILEQAGWRIATAHKALQASVGFAILLACNLAGLAFCGMEHSLHLSATLACVLGAQMFLADGRIRPWWLAAAVICPLLRYEGMTVMLGTAVLLWLHKRRYASTILFCLGCTGPVLFGVWLIAHGLPALPDSILVKAQSTLGTSGTDASLFQAWVKSRFAHDACIPLLWFTIALIAVAIASARLGRHNQTALALLGLAICLPQLLIGRFDGFSRYELYAVGSALAILAALSVPLVQALHGRTARLGAAAVLFLLAAWVSAPYAARIAQLPAAANDIYRQQYQLHRIAIAFGKPVAVNDLGWVSYGNRSTVLDLWGLGSDEARLARATDNGSGWMERLSRKDGVRMVMIYSAWFAHIPTAWKPVGHLRMQGRYLVNGGNDVEFFSADADSAGSVRSAIMRAIPGLPAGATIQLDMTP
jgi:hypothetical protein